jgi:hypothetical protein
VKVTTTTAMQPMQRHLRLIHSRLKGELGWHRSGKQPPAVIMLLPR